MVRWGVALNPDCPIDILERLSKDKDWYVREEVAKNPNCPNWLKLEMILNDK